MPKLIVVAASEPGTWTREPKVKISPCSSGAEGLAAFSSRGPTAENRLKPDVVAPGTAILSTRSQIIKYIGSVDVQGESGDAKSMYLAGTSMATPLVAGCCAVIREASLENGYRDTQEGVKNPTGSLVKALLINGAVPIKGQYIPDEVSEDPGPHCGFGRVGLVGPLPRKDDPRSGYGIGAVDEDEEAVSGAVDEDEGEAVPVTIQIPVPD